ncbi:MAG: hypothetical protein ACO1SX_02895 [Actinomycetota bacterium]
MTSWECAVCGWDNETETCGLCRNPRLPLGSEATAAAVLIHEAELELTRATGWPIRLVIHGKGAPQTVAEARELINDARAAAQLEMDEEPEWSGLPAGYY